MEFNQSKRYNYKKKKKKNFRQTAHVKIREDIFVEVYQGNKVFWINHATKKCCKAT